MRKLHVIPHGYTAETFAIAEGLYRSDAARRQVIRALEGMGKPISYSNQDFDLKQRLASTLADLLRKAQGTPGVDWNRAEVSS